MRRSGVRLPSAPPSFALNPIKFRGTGGVLGGRGGRRGSCVVEGVQSYGWRAGVKVGVKCITAYILQSISHPEQFNRGHSTDLKQRVADHNDGRCLHTSKFVPWRLKFYAAFDTLEQAQRFEAYLKSGSGHAFAKRHLL